MPGLIAPDQLASFKDVPTNQPLEFVKIGSVTAEIFQMWTNIAITNVAWTNITGTFGICSRCSREPTLKVWSKSGQ